MLAGQQLDIIINARVSSKSNKFGKFGWSIVCPCECVSVIPNSEIRANSMCNSVIRNSEIRNSEIRKS